MDMEKKILAEIHVTEDEKKPMPIPMLGTDSAGNVYAADNISLLKNGRRFLPVMGEFHFSRWEVDGWEEAIRKMQAGGVEILATYVFWIHHEEERGCWDFSGNRDIRMFLKLCKKLNMPVWLRIGPWAHGECRNGGFPDWLLERSKEECFELRSNAPEYIALVEKFWKKLAEQCKGMMCKDGGPVLGIQIENEYGHVGGPSDASKGAAHITKLKQLATELGFVTPFYTATGWGGAHVVEGETLPVLGGYVDAPWELSVDELPAKKNFLFMPFYNDAETGSDSGHLENGFRFSIEKNPYLTAELGAGIQATSHRRTYPFPEDIEANALCMLGSGANLIGYYMYHGGINPDGKFSTLEETPGGEGCGFLPKKSYDFQTCIGESGEISESYGRLKKIHLFVKDFGESLCGCVTALPDKLPSSPEDMETLRVSLRYSLETEEGFLFVNNHQRKRQMLPHHDFSVHVTVKADLPEYEKAYDLEHLWVNDGECGVIPFGLKIHGNVLSRTNAFLLCKMYGKRVFYADEELIREKKVYFEWADGKSHEERILLLSTSEANRIFRFSDGLYLTEHPESCLLQGEDGLQLLTKDPKETIYKILPDGTKEEVIFDRQEIKGAEQSGGKSVQAAFEQTKEARDGKGKLLYREYRLHMDQNAVGACHQLYLALEVKGDRAEVYRDGKLIDDWFTTGRPWHVALKRFDYPENLTIRVYDSGNLLTDFYGDRVYYDLPVEKGCSLDGAELLKEYCFEEA